MNKQSKYFLIFSKKHILLYVGIILALVLPLLILLGAFTDWFKNYEKIYEFSGWASLIAGVITYIGAAILGVVAYYNTWLHQYREEMLDYEMELIRFNNGEVKNFYEEKDFSLDDSNFYYEYSQNEFISQNKEYGFKYFKINNFNRNYPLKITLVKVELSIDNGKLIDCTNDICVITDFDLTKSIDYKTNSMLLLGINNDLLKKWSNPDEWHTHSLNIIIRINNLRQESFYKISIIDNDSSEQVKVLTNSEKKKLKKSNYYVHHILSIRN